jgi:hypothetical protein
MRPVTTSSQTSVLARSEPDPWCSLDRWIYRTFLRHPPHDRFSGEEFVLELERQQFRVSEIVYPIFGDFVMGVGRTLIFSNEVPESAPGRAAFQFTG